MKMIYKSSILAIFLVLGSFHALNETINKVKIVVIDAGHGGHDVGCSSAGVYEKDIALSIALKLGEIIKENLDDVKVIYTRDDDNFKELWERASQANKEAADVFLSVHCNANNNANAYGTETYVMGLHKQNSNLSVVAERENSSILLEENYEEKYDGFDPTSQESHILFSLYQNENQDLSLLLASKVEDQFKNRVQRRSRGVKQAGFVVLWKTAMPSVLIETGFLTNPTERNYLSSDLGQVYIASGIYRALKEYKLNIEGSGK